MAMQSKTLRSNVPLKSTIAEWITRNEATRVRIARTALSMATTEAMVLEAIHELKVLARLRRKNRDQMHKIGITKFLARLLDHKDGLIRCDSLDLLSLLVEDDAGKVCQMFQPLPSFDLFLNPCESLCYCCTETDAKLPFKLLICLKFIFMTYRKSLQKPEQFQGL